MATVTKPIALDESLNTTEQTPRNVADVLAQELARIAGRQASDVNYDNTDSGLTADNVQDAIDELKSDIPTVNDGTLTIQQNGETKGTFTANQSGNSTVNIEIPTTDIQTAVDEFETYNGGLLSECKVALSPNQDLHGYPKPWVGGAGKNLFNPTALTTTTDGVTFTNNGDGTYALNGTATADIDFSIESFSAPALGVQYRMVGCPTGLSSNAFLQIRGTSWMDDGNGSTQTSGDTSVHPVQIRVKNGATFNNVVFKPMFSLDTTITYADFEPYENICPISGHTQSKVRDDGKNRLDISATEIGTAWNGQPNTARARLVIPCKPSTYYTLSMNGTNNISNIYIIDTDIIPASGAGTEITSYPYTYYSRATSKYIVIAFSKTDISQADVDALKFQLEEGQSATAYVPYNGYQVTVNLGGTYYSGILDIVSGVFVPDMVEKDMGDITYNYNSAENIFGTELISDMADPIPTKVQLRCSALNALTPKDIAGIKNADDNSIAFNSVGATKFMRIKCTSYIDGNALKTAMTGQKIVYEIANPTSIQLSPTMVKALVGENHLSAPLDGQEITESKYKQMFTFDDVIAYIQSLS